MKEALFIGKVARLLGIRPQAIRYYERLGLIPRPARARNGYRAYSAEHVERLKFVQKAKRFGLSLQEIGRLIDIREEGSVPCEEVKRLIKAHLDELDSRIQNMVAFRDDLATRYRKIEQEGSATGAVCGLIERQD